MAWTGQSRFVCRQTPTNVLPRPGDGEAVVEGEALFLLEADKSTNEVEAPASGVLRIIGVEGETYPVGTVIGHIE